MATSGLAATGRYCTTAPSSWRTRVLAISSTKSAKQPAVQIRRRLRDDLAADQAITGGVPLREPGFLASFDDATRAAIEERAQATRMVLAPRDAYLEIPFL